MKKVFLALFVCGFLGFTQVTAQDVTINEVLQYMSKGEQTGFEVAIPEGDVKRVESAWKKAMKSFKGKVIASKKATEIFTDNASIPLVSPNTVDIYSTVRSAEYGAKLTVFVDLGGAFVSSQQHAQAYGSMEGILREFALDELRYIADQHIDAEEKQLKILEKDLEKLIKEKEDYIKDIEEAKALILQRETDIATNEQNQVTKNDQIAIQQEILQTVIDKKEAIGQ